MGFGAILALLAPPKRANWYQIFFYVTGNIFISVENRFEDQISAAQLFSIKVMVFSVYCDLLTLTYFRPKTFFFQPQGALMSFHDIQKIPFQVFLV